MTNCIFIVLLLYAESNFIKLHVRIVNKVVMLPLLLLLTGCHERTECPAFSEEYNVWLPQAKDKGYNFIDGRDTFKLNVIETYRSAGYTLVQPLVAKKPCEIEARVKMAGNSTSPKIEFYCSYYYVGMKPEEVFYNISFLYSDYSYFGFNLNDGILSTHLPGTAWIASYYNGYKLYNNILKLDGDTLIHNPQVIQVYIAKSVGIIQFKDRFNHKTWSLIE
jgi:hypothetical protein